MNKETAKEIAKDYLIELFGNDYSIIIGQDEKGLAKLIIEYAKAKCTEQREISWKLFQSSEIDGKKITLDAKTPDFK